MARQCVLPFPCNRVPSRAHKLEHFPANSNFEISYTLYIHCSLTLNQYQCSESQSWGGPVENIEPLFSVIGRRAEVFDHNHSLPYKDSTITLRFENAVTARRVVLTQKKSVVIHIHSDGSCE